MFVISDYDLKQDSARGIIFKMLLPYRFRRCIHCLERRADSMEHLIPQSVGGRLKVHLLCSDCNNTFGSKSVSGLRKDQSIRMAVDNLKPVLPKKLYQEMREGLALVGRTEDGLKVRATQRKGKLLVLHSEDPGRWRIKGIRETKREIKRHLDKMQRPEQEKNQLLARVDSLVEGEPLVLPGGQTFVKQPVSELFPDSTGCRVDERVPALIAYEFLALLLGEIIYDESFDGLRRYIRTGAKSNRHEVRRMAYKEYEPAHMIAIEVQESDFNVNVCFFGWLVFVVKFKNSVWRGPDIVCREDLKLGRCFLAKSRSDARKGIWYEFRR